MSTAIQRIEVFQDTMNWIKTDKDLSDSIKKAKKNTEIFWEDIYPSFNQQDLHETKITVSSNRSFEEVVKLNKQMPGNKISVMNFVNAFHAGGGVTSGGSVQEECLYWLNYNKNRLLGRNGK